MTLGQLFPRKVVTASPKDSLAFVAARMQEHNVGAVVVTEDDRPVGIVTDRDLALAMGARAVSPQAPVETVMASNVRTILADEGVFTATRHMRDYEVRRLPVVDAEGRLVGIVTLDDLLRLLGREQYELAEGIRHEVEVR
jgi:CBS domain-containing protein